MNPFTPFTKFREWIRLRQEPPVKRIIKLSDDGLEISVRDSMRIRVLWSSVVEIAAFKHDLVSIDEICIGFRREGEINFWWAGEEDIGFEDLQATVGKKFPDMRSDWFGEVAVPAFQENWTTLWRKPEV